MGAQLYQQIREFYDASSPLWESIWGEHMHHGFYGLGGTERLNRRQAQIELIEEFLAWGKVGQVENFVDVGCGIGGSTLYLAEKFNAKGVGITLSPVQANRAIARAAAQDLQDQVEFKVADALNMPFRDGEFDLVWTLESGEHMPNKRQFLQECTRVLKPGGKLLMATWCHRPTDSVAGTLTPAEQKHLEDLYRVYCLPYVISLPDYQAIATECGLENIETADWSTAVAPFWDQVIDSAITPDAVFGILKAGWQTIQGALALDLMKSGFRRGLIRYGLLQATKSMNS
ncbi:delta(24)-sterol C-methyltransferase [Picosynechococcus sp. PCC 7003]|uniref:methyltransferase domain-containing protein n=1 Tax=Picosynechococcus sp. PCC 7003 TaxID=374981 RepID=UPI0008107E09|nr:methyltransferase domain-containing protein [Picosynechococcus sp. PCC 7003]ANV84594.1 delta(24)-sterol C-methyltransferase [Picosynechococcus sp. PCC 7003]